ncbi:hypothetical protein BDQ17DRAFT_712639 [Cyathus striatus]|nr:hypothetical protein BDQ17DRAFT_712639 [Cyathus striatus]
MMSTIPANVQSAHSLVLDGHKDGKVINGSSTGNGHGSVFLNSHPNSRIPRQNGVMNDKNGYRRPDPSASSAGRLPVSLPADPATAKKLLSSMKKSAASFSVSGDSSVPRDALYNPKQNNVDGIHGQTMQVALLGGEIGTAQDISDFQQQMRDQDKRQKDGIEEIQCLAHSFDI